MRAHKVGQGKAAVGHPCKDRSAFVQRGYALPGEVVVAEQPAAVRVAFQRFIEELGEQLALVDLHAEHLRKFVQEIHPRIDVGGAVGAVHHCHRLSGRCCDHVDLAVHAEFVVGHDHREVRRTGRHVARPLTHGVCCHHARARIAFARGKRNARLQIPCGIQEGCALRCQFSCHLPGDEDLRQNLPQLPGHALGLCQRVKLFHHPLVVVILRAVDREHPRCFADAHDLLAGQECVDVSCKGGEEGNVLYMLFSVQNRLIEVGNAPALRNCEAEQPRQLFRCLSGDRVAPGAESGKLLSVLVKGQVAVHHAGHADRSEGLRHTAELFGNVPLQIGIAGADAGMHGVHIIRPDAVNQLVFPFKPAGSDRKMFFIQQHGFDSGGAELDAEYGFCKVHDNVSFR